LISARPGATKLLYTFGVQIGRGDSAFVEAVLREADERLDLLTIMDILELDFNIIHVTLKV